MLLSGLHTWRQLVRFRIARSSAQSGRRRALQKRRSHDVPAIVEKLDDRTLLSATVYNYNSDDTPQAIPDQTTIFSTITVADDVSIDDVNVTLDISHNRDQDLDVFLIAPGGTRVELFTDGGGGGDNFAGTTLDDEAAGSIVNGSAPFAATYRPEGSLSALDGKNSAGIWSLEVTDDKRRESGTLNSWSIEITSAGPPTLSMSDVTVTEGDASIGFLGVFVSAGSGGLDHPNDLAFGPDGNLYVIAFGTESVRRYDGTSGAFIDTFVTSGSGGLDDPVALVFGPDGDLYVASALGDSVLRYDGSTGAFLEAYVSTGSGGLDRPNGLLFDADSNLYVSSRDTDEILRYGAAAQAAFTVSLSSPSALPVTVNYSTANGTATSGSDYNAFSGTITFAPGETTRAIVVSTIDDLVIEGDETFVVNLTSAFFLFAATGTRMLNQTVFRNVLYLTWLCSGFQSRQWRGMIRNHSGAD